MRFYDNEKLAAANCKHSKTFRLNFDKVTAFNASLMTSRNFWCMAVFSLRSLVEALLEKVPTEPDKKKPNPNPCSEFGLYCLLYWLPCVTSCPRAVWTFVWITSAHPKYWPSIPNCPGVQFHVAYYSICSMTIRRQLLHNCCLNKNAPNLAIWTIAVVAKHWSPCGRKSKASSQEESR